MAYSLSGGRLTAHQESLQCLACAARRKLGEIDYTTLLQLMKQDSDDPGPQANSIWSNVVIDQSTKTGLSSWAKNPANKKLLDTWVNSSVYVADSLAKDKHFKSGDYVFYRQDQFPTDGASFKQVFTGLMDEIRHDLKTNPEFAKSYAGKIYNNITIKDDKWNPADFIAIKKGFEGKWANLVTERGFDTWASTQTKALKQDLVAFAKTLKGKDRSKLRIVESMQHLYLYNKLIGDAFQDGEFIPISLKQSKTPDPGVQAVFHREPKDLNKYFKMNVEVSDVKYNPDNQKAEIEFDITNLKDIPDSANKWKFDVRGFETTRDLKDIQLGLLQRGTGAKDSYHGKITLKVITEQIRGSGGSGAIRQMLRKKRELWKEYSPPGKIRPDPGMLKKWLIGNGHGFIDYRLFDELAKKNSRFLTEDIRIVAMMSDYAAYLSNNKTTAEEFGSKATSRSFYNKMIERGLKKGKDYSDVSISFTQAKYMKNKIQSYEVAHVVDYDGARINTEIKKNILKSMWMYAASKGFAVFKNNETSFYLLAGSYLKCAA
tara:strand:- start:55 stop:1686 length:1632 start_codon:yes stop_codon:yes gene_type:complete